jgi:thiamine pyrophosphate-dependent acetolactate synthase large subunit-like protein
VREEIPILTVLMNNSHFGNYERMIPTSARLYDSAALSGDFSAVAKGLGLHSERVDTPEALVPALKRAAQSTRDGRAALVEVITTVEARIPYAGEHLEDLEPGQ